jgi:hypothetical protein
MADDPDLLSFSVSNKNLNAAMEALRALGGLAVYPEAYNVIVLERNRRELRSPPQDLRLTRQAFEGLPHEVQHLLMEGPQ